MMEMSWWAEAGSPDGLVLTLRIVRFLLAVPEHLVLCLPLGFVIFLLRFLLLFERFGGSAIGRVSSSCARVGEGWECCEADCGEKNDRKTIHKEPLRLILTHQGTDTRYHLGRPRSRQSHGVGVMSFWIRYCTPYLIPAFASM